VFCAERSRASAGRWAECQKQHLELWPDSADVVAICGPPAMFAALDVESLDS
jgi:NAD(P)H-flavin reductase